MTKSGCRDFEAELISLIPQLRAFGRTLSGDSSLGEDLAQDTLAKAWMSQDRFEMGTNMRAWLFTILRNIFTPTCAGPGAHAPSILRSLHAHSSP